MWRKLSVRCESLSQFPGTASICRNRRKLCSKQETVTLHFFLQAKRFAESSSAAFHLSLKMNARRPTTKSVMLLRPAQATSDTIVMVRTDSCVRVYAKTLRHVLWSTGLRSADTTALSLWDVSVNINVLNKCLRKQSNHSASLTRFQVQIMKCSPLADG